jgi:hypothetical protein
MTSIVRVHLATPHGTACGLLLDLGMLVTDQADKVTCHGCKAQPEYTHATKGTTQ